MTDPSLTRLREHAAKIAEGLPVRKRVVLRALAEHVGGRKRWNEPPALYIVSVDALGCELFQWPIPDAHWQGGVNGLQNIATTMLLHPHAQELRTQLPGDFYGVAFRHEAWYGGGIMNEDGSLSETHQSVVDAAGRHELYKHPARIETRVMCAVDRDGGGYELLLPRGHDLIGMTDRDSTVVFTGRVFRALDSIVSSFTGVTLPERIPGTTEAAMAVIEKMRKEGGVSEPGPGSPADQAGQDPGGPVPGP